MLRLKQIVSVNNQLDDRGSMLSKVLSEILFLEVDLDYDVSDRSILAQNVVEKRLQGFETLVRQLLPGDLQNV